MPSSFQHILYIKLIQLSCFQIIATPMLETCWDWFLFNVLFHYVIIFKFCHSFVSCLFKSWSHGILESIVKMFEHITSLRMGGITPIKNSSHSEKCDENQNPTLSLNCMDFYQSRKLTNKQKQNNKRNSNFR